ncbi:MAG: hypothetical protein IBJ12_14865 [Sphingomonadaceae bacterium]|nr:hypothetical protein [Sphingomonadaceae bacterium]
MLSLDPLGLDSDMLDEARAYLHVGETDEDPSLASCLLAAVSHAEQFTRQVIFRRSTREILTAASGWQALEAVPVQTVTAVTGIPAEGPTFALASDRWEAKVGSRGEAYVRILQPGSAGRVEIGAIAGLATTWAALPESLRLGLLRLTAHFHAHRDDAGDAVPPAAALALLLPWRRMRLS